MRDVRSSTVTFARSVSMGMGSSIVTDRRILTSPSLSYCEFIGNGAGIWVDASFSHGCGNGVRRTTLHELLIRRAGEARMTMAWETRVGGLSPQGIILDGAE